MGMRQVDMIGIVGKTQDAVQAQQTNARGHATQQDQIAVQQAARAEHASEQVSAVAPEDRLELSTDGGGGSSGGESGGHEHEEEQAVEPEVVPEEHQIDFLA